MATQNSVNNELAGQEGTGKFVGDVSPNLTTPDFGAATGTSINLSTSTTVSSVLDEDDMVSNSATALATQQSIKAYFDDNAAQVLQVVQSVDTTNRSTTSASFVDSGISVTITPSSTSSRISLSVVGVSGNSSSGAVGNTFTLYRDATPLTPSGTSEMCVIYQNSNAFIEQFAIDFIDSPATTSAITYYLYFATGTATAYIGRRGLNTVYDVPTVFTATELRT